MFVDNQRSSSFLVIPGIPGTGKSTYSRWLPDNHDFTHFDIDRSHPRDGGGLLQSVAVMVPISGFELADVRTEIVK
jgi:hypothetical protein